MKSVRRSSEGVVIPEQKQIRFFRKGESPRDLPNALRAVRCASNSELPAAIAKAQAIANRHAVEPYVQPTNTYPTMRLPWNCSNIGQPRRCVVKPSQSFKKYRSILTSTLSWSLKNLEFRVK